jgi:NAD-dependent dihydropyrimidine dehydrogenase PreA subunit
MNRIIINKEMCNGCKTCFKSCFIDVIKWDDEKKRPFAAYPEDCVQCMFCELNCPKKALRVIEDYKDYMFPRDHVADM